MTEVLYTATHNPAPQPTQRAQFSASPMQPAAPTNNCYEHALRIVSDKLRNRALLSEEFQEVVRKDQMIDHEVLISQSLQNGPRNRYVNVVPYDFNCVQLSAPLGYVNASFVKYSDSSSSGSGSSDGIQLQYIATQGPLQATVQDFWQMVLEQRIPAIVMLTNIVERGVIKCAPYFPSKEGEKLALKRIEVQAVQVTCSNPALTIRTLQVTNLTTQEKFTVQHYHYHAWPDHGTPEESLAIRALSEALIPSQQAQQQVVVHCSAGIGRTGTFLAVDILRQRLRQLSTRADVSHKTILQALNLPDLVHQLRQQRMGMVQTLEQYIFIYQSLQEELQEIVEGKPAPHPENLRLLAAGNQHS